jgi:AraC-like DNA-binding protein
MFQWSSVGVVFYLFLVSFSFVVKATDLSSNKVILNAEQTNFFSNIQYQSTDLTFDEIIQYSDGWKNVTSTMFNAGFSPKVYWLKQELENTTENKEWFLTLDNTRLDFVDFYLISDGVLQHLSSGDQRPLSGQLSSNPTFKFHLPSKKSAQLYLRIQSESQVAFLPQIRSSFVYGQYHSLVITIHVLYIFILVFFIALQIILTKQIANKINIYYTIGICFGFAYCLFYFGEGNLLFWPDNSVIKNLDIFIFALFFCIFFSLFLQKYLSSSVSMPVLHTLLNGYIILVFISIIITLFSVGNFVRVILVLLAGTGLFLFTFIGTVRAIQQNNYWSLWLSTPLIFTIIALFIYVGTFLELLSYTTITSKLVLWSVPFDAILITLSVIFRHYALHHERDELLVKLENISKQYNDVSSEQSLSDNINQQELKNRLNNINPHTTIIKLVQYLDKEKPFLEPHLSLEKVASVINVRSDQLSTLINSELSTSFPTLINIKRLNMAANLLKDNPNKNIINIALECGFNSKSNFNRLFKEHFDTTPTLYRKSLN